jgi:hypothetical protein
MLDYSLTFLLTLFYYRSAEMMRMRMSWKVAMMMMYDILIYSTYESCLHSPTYYISPMKEDDLFDNTGADASASDDDDDEDEDDDDLFDR